MTIVEGRRRIGTRPSIARAATHGVFWALGQNIGFRVAAFLAQLALARLLTPADFGQVSLALSINNIVTALTDFGIEDVLMSRRRSFSLWLGPAYCLSLMLSCLGATLMLLVSPVAAAVFHAPGIVGLLAVLAINAVASGLSTVPNTKLRADLRFGWTSGYGLAEFVVSQLLAIGFAALGFGAYAFVLPHPILASIKAPIFRRLVPIRLRGAYARRRWRYLLGRGGLVFGHKLLQSAREQGDYVVLGIFSTQDLVGAYALGFRLAAQPVYALVRSLGAVLFPTLSTLSREPDRQMAAALRVARILAFVITPLSFLQAAASEPVVLLLFGSRWQSAVPFVQILSIGLAFDVLPCVAGALASARGRFTFQLQAAAATTVLFLLSILTGLALAGPIGLAWGVTASFAACSLVYPILAFGPMPRPLRTLSVLMLSPALLSAGAVATGMMVAKAATAEETLPRLIVLVAASMLTYAAALAVFAPGSARDLMAEVKRILRTFSGER